MALTTHELRRHVDGGTTVRPTTSKVFCFPGGEAHIAFAEPTASTQIAYLTGGSGDDLVALGMWADAVRRSGQTSLAVIPYLPGARQDRGRPLGAKVFADIINGFGIDQVVCFDPHSDVIPALLDRLTVVTLDDASWWHGLGDFTGVIVPDAGARKRAELVAGRLNVPIFQAMKHRDFATGRLTDFTCEPLPDSGRFLVVDDICDGGRTFLGLADATGVPRERLGLWVSHGVCSPGSERLAERFGLIATTDSHPGAANGRIPGLHVIELLDRLVDAALNPRNRKA